MKNILKEKVKSYLLKNNIPTVNNTNKCVLSLILNGYRKAGWSAQGARNWTKKYFPDKPKNMHLYTYILLLEQEKICSTCNEIKSINEFNKSKSRLSGYNGKCKNCDSKYRKIEKNKYKQYNAKYKAALLNRVPKWANLQDIADFYSKCPEGYHVDHIIPLQGDKVSGLHILENLQYLTARENLSKGNKFEPL